MLGRIKVNKYWLANGISHIEPFVWEIRVIYYSVVSFQKHI